MNNKKNKKHLYIIIGFMAVIAFFNSVLASSHPDGLERVAEDLGFIDVAHDSFSIFGDYTLNIPGELLSTGLAGILGAIVTFGLIYGIGKMIKYERKKVSENI